MPFCCLTPGGYIQPKSEDVSLKAWIEKGAGVAVKTAGDGMNI